MPQRADPFAAREFVDLGRHDCGLGRCAGDPRPCRSIAFESRVSDIHQQQCCRIPIERRASDLVECRLCGATRFGLSLSKAARVTVPGEIHQVQRRCTAARDPVHVGEPRLARLSARTCQLPPDERVDQTRFANVRTPYQDDFGQTCLREAVRGSGTGDELSGNLQWVIVSSVIVPSTGSACDSAGRRPASGSASAIFRTSSIVWTR